jgi:hypothetical protein
MEPAHGYSIPSDIGTSSIEQPALSPRHAARFLALGAVVAIAVAAVLVMRVDGASRRAERPIVHDRGHSRALPRAVPAVELPALAGATPLSTLPFPPNRADRPPRRGEVPSLYADGASCSVGCRPYRAQIGWPLVPFHEQHPIRAGLNELRPESLHVGLDIQAADGAAVYAVQPGVARVLAASGPDARVEVGSYIYWHIAPRVRTGQLVVPFKTVLGTVMSGYGHMAFSELNARGDYVNPLRPGGTVLEPYVDHAPPVIAKPAVSAGGQVIVAAYDSQTFVRNTTYLTPVLAPAAIAYRLYDGHGAAVTPLEWSFRGTHLLPFAGRSLIYAPGAHPPGYTCFATRSICVPDWTYRVAGGLAPPLPPALAPGSYRLTIYAWDWADNRTALDTTLTLSAAGWQPIGRFPSMLFHIPGYFERQELYYPQASAPRTRWTPTRQPRTAFLHVHRGSAQLPASRPHGWVSGGYG